jgi:multidrug efflux pump
MGGMFGATVLGVFFVPIFFVTVRRLLGDKSHGAEGQSPAEDESRA